MLCLCHPDPLPGWQCGLSSGALSMSFPQESDTEGVTADRLPLLAGSDLATWIEAIQSIMTLVSEEGRRSIAVTSRTSYRIMRKTSGAECLKSETTLIRVASAEVE